MTWRQNRGPAASPFRAVSQTGGQKPRGLAGAKIWAEERLVGGISEQGTRSMSGGTPASLAIYRHIPGTLPQPHQGPSLICCVFQGKMEWHPLQGALAEPLSSLVVGMAQVPRDNAYPSGPSEELRLTGHTGGSHPAKPPRPLVLGLCKGIRTQHSLRGHGAAVVSDRR